MANNIVDLRGKRFGKLLALEIAGKDESGSHIYRCRCECGRVVEIERQRLVTRARDCGCERGRRQAPVKINHEPWRDCNGYLGDGWGCGILTEMMCVTRGKCKFYKKSDEKREG